MLRVRAAGIVLVAVACASPPQAETSPDLSVVRAQIDSLWTRYSAAAIAGDVDGIARLYGDSVYIAELGLPTIRSAAELRTVAGELFKGLRIIESTITPEITDLVGNRAIQYGTYRDVVQATGQPTQVATGRFTAVLQRDSTSGWRVTRLVAFADSTVPASRSR